MLKKISLMLILSLAVFVYFEMNSSPSTKVIQAYYKLQVEAKRCTAELDKKTNLLRIKKIVQKCMPKDEKRAYISNFLFYFSPDSKKWFLNKASGFSEELFLNEKKENIVTCVELGLSGLPSSDAVQKHKYTNKFSEFISFEIIKRNGASNIEFKEEISMCNLVNSFTGKDLEYSFKNEKLLVKDSIYEADTPFDNHKIYKKLNSCEKFITKKNQMTLNLLNTVTYKENFKACTWEPGANLSKAYQDCVCKVFDEDHKERFIKPIIDSPVFEEITFVDGDNKETVKAEDTPSEDIKGNFYFIRSWSGQKPKFYILETETAI